MRNRRLIDTRPSRRSTGPQRKERTLRRANRLSIREFSFG